MRYVIGLDEVGRGALAGPVVVAAAAIPINLVVRSGGGRVTLRDSKKLSARQRELWFNYFRRSPKLYSAVAKVHPRTIEKINISRAGNRAALRAIRKLIPLLPCPVSRVAVFLDGGLYLGNKRQGARGVEYRAKTIIRGDEKITAVKIASIIAKVTRDRLMVRLSERYPEYGFEIHKGYGTLRHRRVIKKYGRTVVHRSTFL